MTNTTANEGTSSEGSAAPARAIARIDVMIDALACRRCPTRVTNGRIGKSTTSVNPSRGGDDRHFTFPTYVWVLLRANHFRGAMMNRQRPEYRDYRPRERFVSPCREMPMVKRMRPDWPEEMRGAPRYARKYSWRTTHSSLK